LNLHRKSARGPDWREQK